MSNNYFIPNTLARYTTGRAEALNDIFELVEQGFDKLPAYPQYIANYVVASGTANAITLTYTPIPAAYIDGMIVAFKAAYSNTSTATINVNSLGIKSLALQNGATLAAGDIASGKTYSFRYNSTSGFFEMQSVSASFLTAASASVAAAASAQSLSEAAQTAAETALDTFDDRFLGAKASNPATDNDGNALLIGALYWNSSSSEMRVYSGSEWIAAYLPSGSYLQISGGTLTGALTLAGAPTSSLDAATKAYADAAATLPLRYIAGYSIANNATDANNDIDIGAGECRDIADAADIILTTVLTKRLDASWGAGTNQGGLTSSLTKANSTIYWIHAIIVDDVADVGFDTSATAANLVADHAATAYRPLGFCRTNASGNILAWVWACNCATVTITPKARIDVASGLTATSYTQQATTGIIPAAAENAEAMFGGENTVSTAPIRVSYDGVNAQALFEGSDVTTIGSGNERTYLTYSNMNYMPIVAGQVYYKVSSGSLTLRIFAMRHGR